MRTTGLDVGILLFVVFVGVPILIGHFGTAAYIWAGLLILTASVIRLLKKASRAQYVANQLAGTKTAQMLASRKPVLASTSPYINMILLAELSIVKHAAQLTARRRQLTITSNHGLDESRWLQEVECFIDEVIESTVGRVRSSPECLRAVRWMIAGATAQFSEATAPVLLVWEDAA